MSDGDRALRFPHLAKCKLLADGVTAQDHINPGAQQNPYSLTSIEDDSDPLYLHILPQR